MSETIRKFVGRAIVEEFQRQRIDPFSVTKFTGIVPPLDLEAIGAAAIEAMYEPTDAMKTQGYLRCPADWGRNGSVEDAGSVWRAMIDEALK